MLTFTDVIGGLGFVLAVDNCARGCLHCPAYGAHALVQRAPLHQLALHLDGCDPIGAHMDTTDPDTFTAWDS